MEYEEVEVNSERWFDLTPLFNEEFKDIEGFEGLYQVSNYGRIKKLKRAIKCKSNKIRIENEIIMSNTINRKGKEKVIYYQVSLTKNNKKISKQIHRLVAETFIPNPKNKSTVDHIERATFERCNNRVDNLRWATYSEQQRHSFDNCGKISPMKGKINTYNCKKIEQYDDKSNLIGTFLSIHDVDRKLGYNYKNISKCCILNSRDNKIHKSYGYIWKFKGEN